MRFDCLYTRHISPILALAVAAALCLFTTMAMAQDNAATDTKATDNSQMQSTTPAMISGAGPTTACASASSVDKQAWIYTGDFRTSAPTQIVGTIELRATDLGAAATATNPDMADVVSRFTYPCNGSQYVVRFTCVAPPGTTTQNFGGVGILQPVFGSTGVGWVDFPRTLAYVAVFGSATITKDGATIADSQPATAMVTQAIHDMSQKLMTDADPTRREVHLLVPGSTVSGGTAVSGFPSGGFYIYWPDAAVDIRSGAVTLKDVAPAATPAITTGRGPAPGQLMGNIPISLTDDGIKKDVGEAPAGLWDVTVTNNSSRCRGLIVSGIDICCSPYNRFTKLLTPGQSQTFRFFFATGKVTMKDFLDARRAGRSFDAVIPGKFSSSIVFQ